MSDPVPDPLPPAPIPAPGPTQPSLSAGPPPSASPATVGGPERSWEVGCHLAAFSGYLTGLGWILGPMVVWLLKKSEFPSVDAHGKEELNFQISVLIYQVVLFGLGFVTCGVTWALNGVLAIVQLVLMILASMKASNGELYRYPLTIRFLS